MGKTHCELTLFFGMVLLKQNVFPSYLMQVQQYISKEEVTMQAMKTAPHIKIREGSHFGVPYRVKGEKRSQRNWSNSL
jgi:hypothetical protein